MSELGIPSFVKKHLMIKNRAILLVLSVMFLYRIANGLFNFSIVRFLMSRLGDDQYLLIGIFFTVAAGVALVIDIPIGVLQNKLRPRVLLLASVLLLLCSNIIFLFSTLTVSLGLLAVVLYQMSIEVYFITTCTYILRLSNQNNFAQNVAQGDVADNSGQVVGLLLGGMLFFVDSALDLNYYIVIVLLLILIGFLFAFIYEFIDKKNYTSLEKYILSQKFAQEKIAQVQKFEEEILESKETMPEVLPENPQVDLWGEIKRRVPESFRFLGNVLSNPLGAPILFWVVAIIMLTNFWNQCLFIFEPIYVTELYHGEHSLITQNLPRYFFEALMLVASLVIPTFIFEVPLGKLADKFGKDKIIIGSHILGGIVALVLAFYNTTWAFFALYLMLGIVYVGIYPASTGLMNQEYAQMQKPANGAGNSEGESAALISFVMSAGAVMSGVFGALVLDYVDFALIFVLLAMTLIGVGIASWWFLASYGKPVQSPAEVISE